MSLDRTRHESRWWSRRWVAAGGAAIVAATIAFAVYDISRSYRTTIDNASRELDSQARAVAEQTARSLQTIDVVLRHGAQQYASGALAAMSPDELHRWLEEQSTGLVQTASVVVMNADGTVRATSRVPPAQYPPISFANEPTFRKLRSEPGTDLRVDGVRRTRNEGAWVFLLSRRLEKTPGLFDGSVTALARVEYFQRFYGDAFAAAGTRVALLHRDTTLLARYPPMDDALGRKFSIASDMAASAASGRATTRVISQLDGMDLFAATWSVPDYPVVVVVARDAKVVLAPWREQAISSAVRTLALAALASLLLAMTLRQLSRLDAARASLEVSRERYALAAAGSDDGIWDWDLVGDMVFMSPRAQQLAFGDTGEPLRPRNEWNARAFYHPDDADLVRNEICAHLRGATPHFTVEFRLRQPSGDWRWCRQRGIALRDDNGRVYRMAGSMEDVTARKSAAAERERLEQQLRQAQKLEAIGTLAGGIAHDFNNILSAILGYGELAQQSAAEGTPLRRNLDASLAAGARAKSLVERILAFSRSGMGERVPVHVQSVVTEALDSIAATLPAGIRMSRHLAAGDAGILGDPTQIHQVVMNLCANAVQAISPPGVLSVSVDVIDLAEPLALATSTLPAKRYLRLAVRDSGCGITPRVMERIFDPFFTTQEIGVGTGLGLSLVHGIVADLGGGIAVDSRPGEGSVFTVYLATQNYVAPPAVVADLVLPGRGESILFVDDEKVLVRLGEETLATLGYEAVGFFSAAEALDAFRDEPDRFDAVLSDEAMPGMTGSELAAEIRALRPDLPIVLMSGFVSPALAVRAREIGVVEVVSKPLAAAEIARCLASALLRNGPIATVRKPSGDRPRCPSDEGSA